LLGGADRPHGNTVGFEAGPKALREFGGVRSVAMNADRVDADVDVASVDRAHFALTSHSHRATHRLVGVVNERVVAATRDERAVRHVVAVGEYLAGGSQSGAIALGDEMTSRETEQ